MVYVGDTGEEDPGVLRWITVDAEDAILPGGYADFSFQAVPVLVALGETEISDPGYAVGGGGLGAVVEFDMDDTSPTDPLDFRKW